VHLYTFEASNRGSLTGVGFRVKAKFMIIASEKTSWCMNWAVTGVNCEDAGSGYNFVVLY
jgi:hypothetical protein